MKSIKKITVAFLIITLCFGFGAFVGKVYKPVADAAPQTAATILGGNYFNDVVNEVVVNDGIAYVGGEFTSVGKESALAASISTTTGELVTGELGLDTGEGEEVTAVASDGSGGWYIGGYFSSVAGVAINNLAHIESDGSVDETWNPNPNDQIYSISVSGSDIYVAGTFGTIGGQSRFGIAKLNNTNGNADATWDPDPDDYVTGVVVSGSDVYAFGDFTAIGGQSKNYLAKLNNTNGNADATWNPAPDSTVADVKVSGSDVYVAGIFGSIGGQSRVGVAKLNNTNGNADATWNPNSDGSVNSIAISGSDIYVSGNFSDIGGQARNRLAKLNNTNGNADVTWDPAASGFDDGMYAIAVSGTSVYAVGDFTSIGGQSRFGIAKLNNSNGNADSSWNASPDAYVTDIAVYNSDIYVSGGFSTIGGTSRQHLAAIDLSTNELTSWNPAPNGSGVTDIAVSGSDIYAAGNFTTIGGQSRAGLAKLNNTNGNADASWDPSPNGTVRDIAISDSDIYVGGSFTTIGGQSRNRIAKISLTDNPTGLADASWNPNSSSAVYVITVSGSYIYVGGVFATIGGDSRNGLARLLSDGTADPDWEAATMTGLDEYGNPIVQVEIRDIKISGDNVYIAGAFSVIGGVSINRLARLSTDDASLDSTWNPNPNSHVYSIAFSGQSVVVGGNFTTIGGQSRTYLAKLNNTNGNADSAWSASLSSYVNSVAIYEYSVLVGGNFSTHFKRFDFPTVSFASSTSSGDEGSASPSFVVNLSTASDVNTAVNYSTSGTATSGSDYSIGAGSATITAGQTSVSLPITITQDEISETAETIIITLTDPGSAFLGATTIHTYTIDLSDYGSGIPAGHFAQPSGPNGNASIPYTLKINDNALSTNKVEVTLTFDGGEDIGFMAVSNKQSLSDASIEPYTQTKQWNLCLGLESCASGAYTVYAKLYTKTGQQPSSIFSDGISLETSSTIEPPKTGEPKVETPLPQGPDLFTRNLRRRNTGPDVKILQQFLNNHGYILADTSWGSPGNETEYFGPRTQRALTRFQVFYIATVQRASGVFDTLTRNLVNILSKN